MSRIIRCDDGVVIRGNTDAELLERAWAHVHAAHPDLAPALTDDQLLAMSAEE